MKKLGFLLAFMFPALALAGEGASVFNPWASFGLELGVVGPVNHTWEKETPAFFQGNFIANFQVWPLTSVIGEAGYSAPGNGFNAGIGIQQLLLPLPITPFVSGSAGLRAVPDDNHTPTFGDRIGPTVEVNGGLFFFRESSFQLRLKGGYEWTFNKQTDQGWQVAIGILFADSRPGIKAIDVSK